MEEAEVTILIVDDEDAIRSMLTRKLEGEGYRCEVAADGKEALWKAFMKDFDLVLMDIKMPGLPGMEALPQMVTDHPDTCVIMITAVADAKTAVEAMKLGSYDYVTKPFDLDDLSMRVRRALERRRLVLENREYQRHLEQKVKQQVEQVEEYYNQAIHAVSHEQVVLNKVGGEAQGDGLEEAYLHMIESLAMMAEVHEPYARGHAERVGLRAREIAIQLRCSDELVKRIKIAAMLHDIGKIAIPDHILFKSGLLTPAEYSEVKRHPTVAVEIINHTGYFKDVVSLVEAHHEWYNGNGYPKNLKAESIPLGARIIAVADAYDAMTCPRPYRPRLSNEEAVQILKKGAASQWDPMVVDALFKVLEGEAKVLEAMPSEG
jgi:response regulator RpfG family c-di-GMP phosphodiesterase